MATSVNDAPAKTQPTVKTPPKIDEPKPVVKAAAPTIDTLLASDPVAALQSLGNRANDSIKSYSCTFVKQERIGGVIGKEQTIKAKFRAEPYSVFFHFVENAGLAEKVIYVKDRWVNEDATDPEQRQLATVRPAGAIAQALVPSLKQPIRGALAAKSGRRSIDQFGFAKSLHLLAKYCVIAAERNELSLEYLGEGEFKGRRVWVLKRVLPYTDEDGEYPDKLAMIYIDQEHQVPIAIHTFRSEEPLPEELLGKYEYSDVDFNAEIGEDDFEPKTYGF